MTDRPADEIRDQAAAYVLGALTPEEARAFERELTVSPALRREVAELREVAGLLALGAPPVPRDDDALRARLRARTSDSPAHRGPTSGRRGWVAVAGWAAAAILTIVVWRQVDRGTDLARQTARIQATADSLLSALADRDAMIAALAAPETERILLTSPGQEPPTIQMFLTADRRAVLLFARNLPPAPTGRAYQLWFLGEDGVTPGGTFNPEADGSASVVLAGPPPGMVVQGAAVTEEPAGGSPAPTTPIIVVGTVSP
jgi:anti-sigma-K factor RskA